MPGVTRHCFAALRPTLRLSAWPKKQLRGRATCRDDPILTTPIANYSLPRGKTPIKTPSPAARINSSKPPAPPSPEPLNMRGAEIETPLSEIHLDTSPDIIPPSSLSGSAPSTTSGSSKTVRLSILTHT